MKRYIVAGASALALALTTTPALAQDASLSEQVSNLPVAAEHTSGYDRDAFGDYDRDAVLQRNQSAFPDCDGYYSRYDAECYTSEDEVDVDERVARAEAWRSGAHEWGEAKLDQFGGDMGNLALLTSGVNRGAKSDNDIASWTPQHGVCSYVSNYVATKTEYGLTVDQAEKDALQRLAQQCSSTPPDTTTEPTPPTSPASDDDKPATDEQAGDDAKEDGTAPAPTPQEGHIAVTG